MLWFETKTKERIKFILPGVRHEREVRFHPLLLLISRKYEHNWDY